MDDDHDKKEYFRQLYSLNELSDNGETCDEDFLRDILRRKRLRNPQLPVLLSSAPSSNFPPPPKSTVLQSQGPTKTPVMYRTNSAPVSSTSIVKETPLLPRESSFATHDVLTPIATESLAVIDSVIKETPLEKRQPVRSVSTPSIGSVVMKNSTGIASMLSKKPVLTKKRKRTKEIKLVPEDQRIFTGQTFLYVPNDDIAPLRRHRIEKAIEYGAKWTIEWIPSITHVVVERRFSIDEIMKYLAPIMKLDFLPVTVVLVNEEYPIDCIQFRSLLDPKQERYSVKQSLAEVTIPDEEIPTKTNQSLRVKKGGPRKKYEVLERETPPRSQHSTQVAVQNGEDLQQPEKPADDATRDWNATAEEAEAVSRNLRRGDALDSLIESALKLEHLPFDDDDDEVRPTTNEGRDDAGSSGDEARSSSVEVSRGRFMEKRTFNQDNFSCMKGGTGMISDSNPNRQTILTLEEMGDYYTRIKDEWRARAYRQAVGVLKRQTTKISVFEEAIQLPKIGGRLAKKIVEIVLTNQLQKLEYTKLNPSHQTLQMYNQIYNVGLETASKWVQAGHKTLDDLKRNIVLTPKQLIGIEHYNDFLTRIPRDEVTALGEIVQKAAVNIDPAVTGMIMGSYRRGTATSGDIDMIFTKPGTTSSSDLLPFLHKLTTQLFAQNFLVCTLAEPRDAHHGSKWHGACVLSSANPIWRRIDFLLVPETQMGAALIYFTGDDIFNRSMRLLASQKGMRLNQEGLFSGGLRGPNRMKLTEGTLVEGRDEKMIFERLGVPYREPWERICR